MSNSTQHIPIELWPKQLIKAAPQFISLVSSVVLFVSVSFSNSITAHACESVQSINSCFDVDEIWRDPADNQRAAFWSSSPNANSSIGMRLDAMNSPLKFQVASSSAEGRTIGVVNSEYNAILGGRFAIGSGWFADATLPLRIISGLGMSAFQSAASTSSTWFALGDLRLGVEYRSFIASDKNWHQAFRLAGTIATGQASEFASNGSSIIAPSYRISFDKELYGLQLEMGARFRPTSPLGNIAISHQAYISLANSWNIIPDFSAGLRFGSLIQLQHFESSTLTGQTSTTGGANTWVEAEIRYAINHELAVTLNGGTALPTYFSQIDGQENHFLAPGSSSFFMGASLIYQFKMKDTVNSSSPKTYYPGSHY